MIGKACLIRVSDTPDWLSLMAESRVIREKVRLLKELWNIIKEKIMESLKYITK